MGINKLKSNCGHQELDLSNPNVPKECSKDIEVRCVCCAQGRCAEGWHAYLLFCTLVPHKNLFEANDKFFYWCTNCAGPICVRCLGIEDDYPCEIDQLVSFKFRCPGCYGSVQVVVNPNVTYDEASELFIQRCRSHAEV